MILSKIISIKYLNLRILLLKKIQCCDKIYCVYNLLKEFK